MSASNIHIDRLAVGKIIASCLLTLLSITVAAQGPWLLKKDEDGIKVYTRTTANSNFKSIKVECAINTHLPQMVAFLLDVNKQQDWVYCSSSSRLLQKIGDNEIVFYSEVDLPWPCTNRDYISHIVISQPVPHALTIDAHTEPNLLPVKEGMVRVRKSQAHWDVTTISPGVQKVVYTVEFDPGGTIPAWLVNMFVTKGPLQTFQKLRACLNKPENLTARADFIRE